jgi:two-component system chemotaxis response regulator CheB
MNQRVSICTGSGFLALVIRKALSRSRHLEPSADHRDAGAALAALREPGSVAIVDAELLRDETHGPALRQELIARQAPSILIDARARGLSADLAAAPSLFVVRGSHDGELDLEVIERELLAAVGTAITHRRGPARIEDTRPPLRDTDLELVVLGVSTGGPSLLLKLFESLVEPAIPLLVVQHMPASETAGFAARLSEHTGLVVREVAGGALPPGGVIGVVRGGGDFRIVRRGNGLHLRPTTNPANAVHPNIDEVLASAVEAGVAVGAAILTGMGRDGAAGALAMAARGLPVIAQRPDTCAVAGMPQAVIDNGAARWVQSPEAIASTLNRWSQAARGAGDIGRKKRSA